MNNHCFIITDEESGERLDVFLARKFKDSFSRSQLKKVIHNGTVTLNGLPLKPHYILKANDSIQIGEIVAADDAIVPENIPLDIIYEDDLIIVVNKSPGLVVHPGAGNKEHTLVHALKYYTSNTLSEVGGLHRAGIVHRLDKDTSGLLIVAKKDSAHTFLAGEFKKKQVGKEYAVLVKGVVQHDQGRCDQPIGRGIMHRKKMVIRETEGKGAVTDYFVIQRFHRTTFLRVIIHTGRTHQIRVHMKYLGYPVLGDLVYGVSSPLIKRQAIHARILEIAHPGTKKRMRFEAPLPDDMKEALHKLAE